MATLIRDSHLEEHVRAQRKASGSDRWDEVWEGVYVMAPLPNDEHQFIQSRLNTILDLVVGLTEGAQVRAGVNVSDREDWTKNYRCPDVVVYTKGTAAENRGTFWLGGPDFAVEIVSPNDASRDKLVFYARVGVRELLVIDRDPWALELYRLAGGRLESVARSMVADSVELRSEVVPLTFRLVGCEPRPVIEVVGKAGGERWIV